VLRVYLLACLEQGGQQDDTFAVKLGQYRKMNLLVYYDAPLAEADQGLEALYQALFVWEGRLREALRWAVATAVVGWRRAPTRTGWSTTSCSPDGSR
jgi:hypothetical protein